MTPASGRILAEDGSTVNIVDLLGGAAPVADEVYDIEAYSPRSGRVIGEDGKLYNLVDLLLSFDGGGNGGEDGTTNHAALSNLDFAQSRHTGFASQLSLISETQARQAALNAEAQTRNQQIVSAVSDEATLRIKGDEQLDLGIKAETQARQAALNAEAQTRQQEISSTVGQEATLRSQEDGKIRSDIAAETKARQDALVAEAQTRQDAINAESQARSEAIAAEAQARQQAISTAVNAEAALRQKEDERLDTVIKETNRVLSGTVSQTITGTTLNTNINGTTNIPKTLLSNDIPLIVGGSWVNDADGTLAVYTGDVTDDANTAVFQTKTVSGGNNGGDGSVIVKIETETLRIEATGDRELTIFKGSAVALASGGFYVFENDMKISTANLDIGNVFSVGSNYFIYICNKDAVSVVLSLKNTYPTDFNETNARKIGGFHYSVNRRVNAGLQPINTAGVERGQGWESNTYNAIVSRSVWTLFHRPKCNPEGMVYLGVNVWVDIYQSSEDTNGILISKYNALPVTGDREMNWYRAVERLMLCGKRLLSYSEFIQAAMGSPPGSSTNNDNAWTTSDERQVTGFVERAVSSIGCRDCVGNVWEWMSDIIASGSGTEMWQDSMPGMGQGQMWLFENDNFRAILAGGSHYNGALAGARSACVLYAPWGGHMSFGVRGACEGVNPTYGTDA